MVDGLLGVLGASVPKRVDLDFSIPTDTATTPLQHMEESVVLEQAEKHGPVTLNPVQVLLISLIAYRLDVSLILLGLTSFANWLKTEQHCF